MKSRLTVDFQGVEAGGNQFEPVIRAVVEDSEDPRDGLMKAFFEGLGTGSNWLEVDIWNTGINNKKVITIKAIKPNQLEETVNLIQNRIQDNNPTKE